MTTSNNKPRSLIAALLVGGALLGAGSAFAQYAPDTAQAVYTQPRLIPVDVSINIGWHGDRYWDGRRYWDHDDWMRHHPRAHDPHRDHDRGRERDHRPMHEY
jgi:hypothetical protein